VNKVAEARNACSLFIAQSLLLRPSVNLVVVSKPV
jgi:hypothetical protein